MHKHLTYANVVSTLCLFVVLGGSAAAASKLITGKQIANASITGVDVKNESLLSADIRDGALLAKDFKPGQLPAGPPGQTGPQGPIGPSDAYNQGVFPGGPGISLAAGSWYVRAQVNGSNTTSSPVDMTCTLTITAPGDTSPGKAIATTTLAAGAKGVLPLEQIHGLPAAGSANVECSGPSSWNGLIVAIRVGTVHEI
jgi:hypothetical protein